MYCCTTYESPVGTLTLACGGGALVGLWLGGQRYHGDTGAMTMRDDISIFDETRQWLDAYFAGKMPKLAKLALNPQGSEFRRAVWEALCSIPYGEVTTYGELAKKMGRASARAVGVAVGHNPISIIIPCHRVVGASGSLTGYAGGLERKKWLLEHEGANLCFN